jgi:hypothetical protein
VSQEELLVPPGWVPVGVSLRKLVMNLPVPISEQTRSLTPCVPSLQLELFP